MTKPDNTITIPLFPIAKEIVEKPEHSFNTSRKLFKIGPQKCNRTIRELLEAVGIDDVIKIVQFVGFKATPVEKKKFEV